VIGDVLVAKGLEQPNSGQHWPANNPAIHRHTLTLICGWAPLPSALTNRNLLPGICVGGTTSGRRIGNDGVHEHRHRTVGTGCRRAASKITALGGKYFFDDDQQWPDTQYVVFEYRAKLAAHPAARFRATDLVSILPGGHENGNAFYGTKGVMILGKKDGWKVTLERKRTRAPR